MRLAAYEDAIYHRDADGLSAERAFPLFLFGLAAEVERLTVLGRLDPESGRSHYAVPAGADLEPLPWYRSLADVRAVARAALPTVARVWRVLGRVDAVWVCGTSPVAILVVALAVLRRRRVALGVRQNTLAYARSRFPGRRGPLLAFRVMEGIWRAYARRLPVATVGPELHALYGRSRRRHELAVSLVDEADLAGPEVEAARDYGGAVTLLSVGRLETEKNPLLLADILAALVAGGGEWRLRIVGEGPLERALRERLAMLGVADQAELLGYVALDGGLMDLYRGSDLFLHVSWTEGLPQVLLEAFAARLPVVATEVGGVGPVARGAALLVGPGDAAAAATAVRELASDAELRHRLVEAGLERVRARTAQAERRRLVAFIAGG